MLNVTKEDFLIERYLDLLTKVIENRMEDCVGEIAFGMSGLIQTGIDEKKWELFQKVVEKLIENGKGFYVESIAFGMSELIRAGADEGKCGFFLELAEKLLEEFYIESVASGMSEFIKAGADEGKWELFQKVLEKLIENGNGFYVKSIASGMSELIQAGADEGKCRLFLEVAEKLIENGNGFYVKSIASGMSELIKYKFSTDEIRKALEVYDVVIELNELTYLDHEERKVNLSLWCSKNARAIANLERIASTVHTKVKSDTLGVKNEETNEWTGRKNPLLYTEEIAVFSNLSIEDITKLTDFYKNNKDLFQNNQNSFLRVVRLTMSCKDCAIDVLSDMEGNFSSADELVDFLGKKLFCGLKEKLKISVPKDINIDNFLSSWDLEHLGTLMSTESSWNDEDRNLFKLLIESKLNGRLEGILTPTKEGLPECSVYGDKENQKLVESIRGSYDRFQEEMKSLGLNAKAWFSAHESIKESTDSSKVKETSTNELLKNFRMKFKAFCEYINKNSLVPENRTKRWGKIQNSEAMQQLMKEEAKPTVLSANKQYLTETLQGFVNDVKNNLDSPNQIPEEIADLEITIEKMIACDPVEATKDKDKRKEDVTTVIWDPQDIGHNLFAGNRANSCTALGSNATAIFYFDCDPGTKYIYTKNKKGNITGYARVFLALDSEGKAKLFVDSVDGRACAKGDYQTPIKPVLEKMRELCELIGLKESDIIYRSSDLSKKIGGMNDSYFHHATFKQSV